MFSNNCASVPLVANLDGNGNNNGWGTDGGWLWFVIVLAVLFGWGGNGFGGNGRDACATQADVRAAVDQQTLISKLDQQTYGLSDSTYALNNSIMNGFHGVDNAICTLGYQNQQGFNDVAHQISDCCCTTQRAIDGVNYNMAAQTNALQNTMCNNTRDIIDNQNAGTRAIIDYMNARENADLRDKVQKLELSASQSAQNQYLVNQLRPTAIPAYITCSPYQSAYGFGLNNGYGCNTGCVC